MTMPNMKQQYILSADAASTATIDFQAVMQKICFHSIKYSNFRLITWGACVTSHIFTSLGYQCNKLWQSNYVPGDMMLQKKLENLSRIVLKDTDTTPPCLICVVNMGDSPMPDDLFEQLLLMLKTSIKANKLGCRVIPLQDLSKGMFPVFNHIEADDITTLKALSVAEPYKHAKQGQISGNKCQAEKDATSQSINQVEKEKHPSAKKVPKMEEQPNFRSIQPQNAGRLKIILCVVLLLCCVGAVAHAYVFSIDLRKLQAQNAERYAGYLEAAQELQTLQSRCVQLEEENSMLVWDKTAESMQAVLDKIRVKESFNWMTMAGLLPQMADIKVTQLELTPDLLVFSGTIPIKRTQAAEADLQAAVSESLLSLLGGPKIKELVGETRTLEASSLIILGYEGDTETYQVAFDMRCRIMGETATRRAEGTK